MLGVNHMKAMKAGKIDEVLVVREHGDVTLKYRDGVYVVQYQNKEYVYTQAGRAMDVFNILAECLP